MINTWERRDKKRIKGKTYKFKKNGDAAKSNKARHRFRDEDVLNDTDDTISEPDDFIDETSI